MSRTHLGILGGLAVALIVALSLEGTQRAGVLAGYLVGAGLFALAHSWHKRVVTAHPEKSLSTFAVLFLAKLVAVLIAFALLTHVEGVAAILERTSFLLSFTAALLVVSILGNWETASALTGSSART